MSWRDTLLPASFRGVPFVTESCRIDVGRRIAVHEYPQRDQITTEDLGRGARKIPITAYVHGANYHLTRDRLIGALEQPGPGTLVHPYLGRLTVVAEYPCGMTETTAEGGLARFEINFWEHGEALFPTISLDSAAAVAELASAASVNIATDFARAYRVARRPGNVLASAIQSIRGAVALIDATVFGPAGRLLDEVDITAAAIRALERDLAALASRPSELAERFLGIFGTITSLGAAKAVAVASDGTTEPASPGTPTQTQIAENATAIASLVRRSALLATARAAAEEPFASFDDAVAERDAIAALLLAEEERPGIDDDVHASLADLRIELADGITERAADLARLADVTPPAIDSSLVLAWDLYGDATREAEIVTRNALAHGGFVPPVPIKVLTS